MTDHQERGHVGLLYPAVTSREQLEDLIRASPRDDANYLVLADLLIANGDPRGELIALDDAARRAPLADSMKWRRQRAALCSRYPALVPAIAGDHLAWHLGFVRWCALDHRGSLPALEHPACAFVIELTLRDPPSDLRLPSTVRALTIEPLGFRDGIDPNRYLARSPVLERLAVASAAIVAVPQSRTLAALEVAIDDQQLLGVDWAGLLPALSELTIQRGSAQLADLSAWFGRLPTTLRRLSFKSLDNGDEVVRQLADSPLLRQLRVVRLWNAGISRAGGAVLAGGAFAHLELLDVCDLAMDDATCDLALRACPRVRTRRDIAWYH